MSDPIDRSNLVKGGRFNTDAQEAEYVAAMQEAFENGQLTEFLRVNPAFGGTKAVAELAAGGVGYALKSTRTLVGSRQALTIQDQMALDAARRGEGILIRDKLGDPIFRGMEKWRYKVEGGNSVVHYVRDPKTGALMDFKFKKHSNW